MYEVLVTNQGTEFATNVSIHAIVPEGIERAVRVMMPAMFLLLLGLAGYNYFAGGFAEAIHWLFTPDFSKIGP